MILENISNIGSFQMLAQPNNTLPCLLATCYGVSAKIVLIKLLTSFVGFHYFVLS